MTRPGFFSSRSRGFTLIEIAVVIVILGFLLVLLVGISTSLIGQQRREATRQRIAGVETALALYVSQNQRLPCPADGSLAPTDANLGVEGRAGVSPNFTCNLGGANGQTNGVVPWRTLGLAEVDITDGWGTRLTYRVAATFVGQGSMNMVTCDPGGTSAVAGLAAATGYCNAACTTPFVTANCTPPGNVTATRGIEVRNLAGTKIMDPAGNTGAAYVVISHGENRAGGFDTQSVVQAAAGPAAGTEEAKNAANLALQAYYVDDFPAYAAGTAHFDDFVLRPTILTVATKAQLGPRAH